jgi:general secretion pathway protein L
VSLATLALVLLVTAIALPLLQKNRMIDSLQAEVQEATVAAQAGNQLRREVEKLVDGSSYLIKKKQTALTIMQMLDEMTRVIPDDTWVNRIDMNNDEIQLQGQSGAAAGLIALIEASPMFHNTRFRSPVTQVARTEQERFHLSAEAVPGQNE